MKHRFPFSLVFSFMAVLATAPLTCSAAVLEVYPTGDAAQDPGNVQWAVDHVGSPGTVVLKSTDPSGIPVAFNFGGINDSKGLPVVGSGAVIKLLQPDITLTGEGWDEALDEPKTRIVGGGGPYTFSPTKTGVPATLRGAAMVFAVNAAGVTIRQLKLNTSYGATGVYISSANLPLSDHAVVVERNDFSVTTYGALASFSAGFPVKISNNVFKAGIAGQWVGLTLQPIGSAPYDEPVAPLDSSGHVVRFPFEITNNQTSGFLWVFGWGNAYSTDPERGCRKIGAVTQCFPGENGPVLISGNDISITPPGTDAIVLGSSAQGLNHAVVQGNKASGATTRTLSVYPYGHDNLILNNDFSGMQAFVHAVIAAPDTTFSGNILGSLAPLPAGDLPVAVLLSSSQYQVSPPPPTPHALENCVIMKNDYRLINSGGSPIRSAILLASEKDLKAVTGVGGEVKNNLIFEAGRFPEDTGGAHSNIQVLRGLINPENDLPYVHDNRIVGHPASEVQDPGIGRMVSYIMQIPVDEGADY